MNGEYSTDRRVAKAFIVCAYAGIVFAQAPDVTVQPVHVDRIPANVTATRVVLRDGKLVIEYEFTNTGESPITKVQTTVSIGSSDSTNPIQVDDIFLESPLEPSATTTSTVDARILIQPGDKLRA